MAKEDICYNCIRWGGKYKKGKPKPECKVSSFLHSCEDFEHRFKKELK